MKTITDIQLFERNHELGAHYLNSINEYSMAIIQCVELSLPISGTLLNVSGTVQDRHRSGGFCWLPVYPYYPVRNVWVNGTPSWAYREFSITCKDAFANRIIKKIRGFKKSKLGNKIEHVRLIP